MKVKSTLYETISGSLGTLTGAMGLGGAYFKEKTKPKNPNSVRQLVIRNAMKNANVAWSAAPVPVKEAWGLYAGSLQYTNSTGHTVKQTGWTAFGASYVLLGQAEVSTATMIAGAPQTAGYLTSPNIAVIKQGAKYLVKNMGVSTNNMSVFRSPKVKNTVNTNTKGFAFVGHDELTPNDTMELPAGTTAGRYFIRARNINANGSMSLETVIKVDLV